jgi:hypothetical protein|tara:strand:- start:192 stop:329 length:138 start_codon:yes stop_codon:yes gene_type:complete
MKSGMLIVGFVIFSVYIFGLLYMINYANKSQDEDMKNDPELKNRK